MPTFSEQETSLIKALRNNGMTQSQIAYQLGTHQSKISYHLRNLKCGQTDGTRPGRKPKTVADTTLPPPDEFDYAPVTVPRQPVREVHYYEFLRPDFAAVSKAFIRYSEIIEDSRFRNVDAVLRMQTEIRDLLVHISDELMINAKL